LSFCFKEEGKAKASTFKGMCKYHDNLLFNPIENGKRYTPGNIEQEFLFAYRALVAGHYTKKWHLNAFEKLYELVEKKDYEGIAKYFPEFNNFSEKYCFKLELSYKILQEVNYRLEILREMFNENLDNKEYNFLETELIVYDSEYYFAVSTYLVLRRDIEGNDLSYNSDGPIFITIFPQGGNTYILLSYLKSDYKYYSFIYDQILMQNQEQQKIILSNIIANHAQNFYLSPTKWNLLDRNEKIKIENQLNWVIRKSDRKAMSNINLFI
jgi:hypothetical protein